MSLSTLIVDCFLHFLLDLHLQHLLLLLHHHSIHFHHFPSHLRVESAFELDVVEIVETAEIVAVGVVVVAAVEVAVVEVEIDHESFLKVGVETWNHTSRKHKCEKNELVESSLS